MADSIKAMIKDKALSLGFDGVGFTSAEPFEEYVTRIKGRESDYKWIQTEQFSTLRGALVRKKHPWARSILVLVRNYHRRRFPEGLLGIFGRCYLADERKVHREGREMLRRLFEFLGQRGIKAVYDEELPARMAACRAGVATYGKNCLAFVEDEPGECSWVEIIPLVLDLEVEADPPTMKVSCPPECKGVCIKACPTGALYEPLKINPLRCISFLTYYGPDLTPRGIREQMGTWVYGCDRCQEVCPRNREWSKRELSPDPYLEQRAADWGLVRLLTMSSEHYQEKVWPQFFYISRSRVDRWKMNAARALGNLGDRTHVPQLVAQLLESPYENVRAMCAWALGRLGGLKAKEALEMARKDPSSVVREEVEAALEGM